MDNLIGTPSRAEVALSMYAQDSALKLQNAAKENRPWTDRTGHARQRLFADSTRVQNGYQLRLAHGVDYGIWLEFAHERRFAIIEPTITYVGTFEIMPGLNKLLDRLGR